MPTPFPPAPPTVSGNTITVDAFLNNPAQVRRSIENLALNRFIADRIYAEGPRATGGAVLYDQIAAGDYFMARDVQAIEPGNEFPILNAGETMPLVAAVTKWGGSAIFTYEAVRRDRRDILARELVRLRNTIVRKIDTVAIAALNAAPIHTDSATDGWDDPDTNPLYDVFRAVSTIDEQDLGYVATAVIVNPSEALSLRTNDKLAARMPRETPRGASGTPDLLAAADLNGLAGLRWYVSNRQTVGTVTVLAEKQAGGISDELPLYSRTVDEETKERYRVMSARISVPYVTDPKSVVKLTGAEPGA
jgi:hypothetical protein